MSSNVKAVVAVVSVVSLIVIANLVSKYAWTKQWPIENLVLNIMTWLFTGIPGFCCLVLLAAYIGIVCHLVAKEWVEQD